MSEKTPQPITTSSGEHSGCFRNCLIATGVLVVLAMVSVAGIYLVGRAYLQRQLPVWETQYPVLGIALDVLNLDRSSAPADAGSVTAGERLQGVNDRQQMPDDVSLYADPLVETYSVGVDKAVGFQRVASGPDQVARHLRDQMSQAGWDLAREQETAWGQVLVWEKGERTCQMEVVGADAYTEIWIRYNDGKSQG